MIHLAMILTDEFEDSEVQKPLAALLQEQGFHVSILAPEAGRSYTGKKGEVTVRSDQAIDQADPGRFDGLVIPGGHSPEKLRLVPGAVDFVRHFTERRKPIAAICHGPQLLVSAGAVRGRRMTCYDSIVVDLRNAGAEYVDQPVAQDGNYVTSRKPADLDAFNEASLALFRRAEARAGR